MSSLTRERLVEASLALVREEGLDALSMRALAERLDVKAASLYWHVRDREELLQLLADAILESAGPARGADWRGAVSSAAASLGRVVARQKDAARILLEVPEALERSGLFAAVASRLEEAGLSAGQARDVALMVMTHVIVGGAPADEPLPGRPGAPASIAIDTGSRGVVLRAGPAGMRTLIRVPSDQAAAAPAAVRGESVVVRRLRGVGHGVIELNPGRPWRFKVQAPTWKTVLDLGGIDTREIDVDSGAAKVECRLGAPRGVVPIHVSSGVAGVDIHRPAGVAVTARVSSGAVKVRLDDFATRVAVGDVHWQSDGAGRAGDRYELEISSGAVKVTLDSYAPKATAPAALSSRGDGSAVSALEILLDGVAARVAKGR